MKKCVAVILITLIFALCFPGCGNILPREMPEDFSFSLTWGTYGISSYDSKTGQLVKAKSLSQPDEYTTTYIMSKEELQTVYDILRKLNVKSYPDEYDPNLGLMSSPSVTIILTVRTGDFEKIITAEGIAIMYQGFTPKGKRFMAAVNDIKRILTGTDEWKALPDYPYQFA